MINHFRTLLCNLTGPLYPGNPYEFLAEAYTPIDLGLLSPAWHCLFGSDPDKLGILVQAHRIVTSIAGTPELKAALTFHDPRVLHPVPPLASIESSVAGAGVTLSASGVRSPDKTGRMSRTFEVATAGDLVSVMETRTGKTVTGGPTVVLTVTGETVSVTGNGQFTLRRYTGPSMGEALASLVDTPLSFLFNGEDPSLLRIWQSHPVSRVRLGAVACALVSKLHAWKGL